MEDSRTRIPWPVVILATTAALGMGFLLAVLAPPAHENLPPDCTAPQWGCPDEILPMPELGVTPGLRGGPPGDLARDNAEYPVGTGPADELLPGKWAAYPTDRDCKWVIEIPPAPDVALVMVTGPDGSQHLQTSHWIAGSTETHWTPGTAVYIQLDAGVRFQTVGCGTWFKIDRPTPSPRVR